MLLSDFYANVYRPLRLLNRSKRTDQLFLYTIRLFSHALGRSATLEDLNDLTIAKHLEALLAVGRKPAGVNKERRQLVALWNLAAKKRLVDQFPVLPTIHEPEQLPKAWTAEELWRLRISCNMQPGEYCGVPAGRWWAALHHVLYSTGERITAVMQLRWHDVSSDVVVFRAETRKGSKRASVARLTSDAVAALADIRSPARELVFPWPHCPTYLYRIYKGILVRAELEADSRSMFHRMRRTHATHLAAAGGDPTTSLGHQSAGMTARYLDRRLIPNNSAKLLEGLAGPDGPNVQSVVS
jgi:integrase